MNFNVSEERGVVVITLKGEIVGGPDASALSEKLHELIAADKKHVVVDMTDVRWMNSSGLGILIGLFIPVYVGIIVVDRGVDEPAFFECIGGHKTKTQVLGRR